MRLTLLPLKSPLPTLPATLALLRRSFSRRHKRERTENAIIASIERHVDELAEVHRTHGAVAAIAWFHRCTDGRWLGGDWRCYHPEDAEQFLRSLQRLPGATRRAVVATMGDLDVRKVRSLAARGRRSAPTRERPDVEARRRRHSRHSLRRMAARSPEMATLAADLEELYRATDR